jgi:peroxiredoxin
MKTIYLLVTLVITNFIFAQLPAKAEDVSPLLIGEKVPEVSLTDINNKSVNSSSIFNKKTVLIFYRGTWCPYCNKHLMEIQEVEKELTSLGYQIVAVSPDAPTFLSETEKKDKLSYQLFSDADGTFTKQFGLAFSTPEKYQKMLSKYSDNKNAGFLPAPALYIINEKGEIEYLHVNPDYSKRISAKMLLAVTKAL